MKGLMVSLIGPDGPGVGPGEWARWPDFTIPVPETSKNLGFLAMKCQKRPKTGLFYLSESLSNLSRMIFSGQASDGSI